MPQPLQIKVARGYLQPHLAVALFTLLVSVACFALMLYVLDSGEQRAIREQEEKTQLLAHAVENTVVRSFQDVIGRLSSVGEALVLNPALLENDNPALKGILKDLLELTPGLREVSVTSATGAWINSSRRGKPDDALKATRCALQLSGSATSDLLIQHPVPGRYLGSRATKGYLSHIPVCVTIRGEAGQRIATVTGALNPDYLKELFRPAHELNPVALELYHYDGHPLAEGARDESNFLQQTHSELFTERLKHKAFGTYQQAHNFAGANNTQRSVITSYRSTSPLPLVMVVHLDLEKGLAPWYQEARFVFWIFIALISVVTMGGSVLVVALLRKYRMEGEIQLLTAAITSTANAIFITDNQGRIQWVNRAFETLTGWPQQEVLGKTPRILNSGIHDHLFFRELWHFILQGQVWRGQINNLTRDRNSIIVDQTITPITDPEGGISHFIAVHEDVTARTEAERRARFLARHDPLTELPNRRAFSEHLTHALTQPEGGTISILFIDLDNFKTINDTLGHQVGDTVLQLATQRISAILPDQAMLARLGGDEFAVMLNHAVNSAQVQRIVEQALHVLSMPLQLQDTRFALSASIGITSGTPGAESAETLLRQADLAMYKAKQDGRNTFSFFDEKMDYVMHRHVALAQGLRDALERNQGLMICYQPIIDSATLQPGSVEILMRWQNDAGEWISPAEFIPVAEEGGLILELGRWQLQTLFARILCWQDTPLAALRVSINISAVQLARDNIAEYLVTQLHRSGLKAHQLIVEVTETALMTRSPLVQENLSYFKQSGIGISIDDFGTGYSSLSYIRELDASFIKIDRSFIIGIGHNQRDEGIILATLALARNLGIKVVAEGVETEAQVAFLREAGVDYLQGYYFARPMFEDALHTYISHSVAEAEATPLNG
jgi:diguanylate cyclase (GGDEF)-like protein/PAS domain S-box-containing protein